MMENDGKGVKTLAGVKMNFFFPSYEASMGPCERSRRDLQFEIVFFLAFIFHFFSVTRPPNSLCFLPDRFFLVNCPTAIC